MVRYLILILFAACAASDRSAIPLLGGAPLLAYQTSLRVEGLTRCSATLVAPTVALGAAHCFLASGAYTVRRDTDGAESAIGRTIQTSGRDLAVIELLTPLSGPYAPRADLPRLGSGVWIAGYGCARDAQDHMSLTVRPLFYLRDGGFEAEYAGRACPGDSGGGIWDAHGGLIGVVHSRSIKGADRVFASDVGGPT